MGSSHFSYSLVSNFRLNLYKSLHLLVPLKILGNCVYRNFLHNMFSNFLFNLYRKLHLLEQFKKLLKGRKSRFFFQLVLKISFNFSIQKTIVFRFRYPSKPFQPFKMISFEHTFPQKLNFYFLVHFTLANVTILKF